MSLARPRWLSQLHVRLALLAAVLLALAGWVLWTLSVAHGERSALEAAQRLQLQPGCRHREASAAAVDR